DLQWECCFFFQAEDGIRDGHVTGVQTCALPIWAPLCRVRSGRTGPRGAPLFGQRAGLAGTALPGRTTLCQSFEAREGPGVEKKEIGRASCRERVKIAVVAEELKK